MKLRVLRSATAWTIAAPLLLLGGYLGFNALFVKVSRTVEVPFSGPAGYDDYYVLRRYLQERGLRVEPTRAWPQPLTRDTALLWFTDEQPPAVVRDWLASGGRLWTFRDPDSEQPENWTATPWPGTALDGGVDAGSDVPVDGGVPVEAGATTLAGPDGGVPADAGADVDSDLVFEDDCRASVHGCLVAAQFAYGTGCLTLVRGYGLENEQMIIGQTPARVDALLSCPSPARRVVIVSTVSSPWFGSLLIARAPEALLAAVICLALWLWHAGRHFGPVHPARNLARRRLLDHISAVGRLALRVGPESLIAAARSELRQRLLRRVLGGRELEGAALVAAAVRSAGHSEAEVTRALLEPPTRAPAQILGIARSIVALWRSS